VAPTGLGRIASFYYLRHATAAELGEALRGRHLGVQEVLQALCATSEYDELPVGGSVGARVAPQEGRGCCRAACQHLGHSESVQKPACVVRPVQKPACVVRPVQKPACVAQRMWLSWCMSSPPCLPLTPSPPGAPQRGQGQR
jgi:hypothetical protein